MFAVFSICVSIATTAFTSTTISFDMDVNPSKRAQSPPFYGYVPDKFGNRLMTFVSMFTMTCAFVTANSVPLAVLAAVNVNYAALYVGGSLGLFLFYRLARGDLHYWVPVYGVGGWFLSLVMRVASKLMVDFTGKQRWHVQH